MVNATGTAVDYQGALMSLQNELGAARGYLLVVRAESGDKDAEGDSPARS
jgi:hypothetical protein